jgi:hypothetical protein
LSIIDEYSTGALLNASPMSSHLAFGTVRDDRMSLAATWDVCPSRAFVIINSLHDLGATVQPGLHRSGHTKRDHFMEYKIGCGGRI